MTESVDQRAVQRRTVAVLSAAQVLGGLGVAVGVAVGGLIAAQIGGTESVAGLAQTCSVLGAGLVAVPIAWLTRRNGRRFALVSGMSTGAIGAAVVVAGSAFDSLPLLLFGLLLFGSATAAGLQARYAATDLAAPERTARSLATVVWATTIGSVLGPNLAEPAGRLGTLFDLPPLTGPFLVSFVGFGCAAAVLAVLLRPDPLRLAERTARAATEGTQPTVGLRATLPVLRARPRALLGMLTIAAVHLAMVSVMVMTPVHMDHVDVSLSVIGLVISVHILGMYGFSPVIGWLADRFGRLTVIVAAAVVTALAAAVSGLAAADQAWLLGIGLFLLGLGWSGGLVAGSALLSESVPTANRASAQGLSDVGMNASAAVGGALAGVIVAQASYGWLNFGTAVLMLGLAGYAVLAWRQPDERAAQHV
ncbi:putative MFS family arabinose efflux permease [Tamaricihabitans halophyticus]|uniref:Putative MFS family arabinose efflux permease n=1 Tax=Tamaricihabitans halophyticus TaxID=1262583 RepID=A0A4R2R634_9PSEU|nr:MFS transporter [Tamaricihabitans halophyticus]TCP55041.1 putative MFS family arabinose efflux permease [Tamaricihabitans halophyticus]